MIPLTGGTQSHQIHRNRNWPGGDQELGKEGWEPRSLFGKMRKFYRWMLVVLRNTVNVPNATESNA